MLSMWWRITMCYSVPADIKYGELCEGGDCETVCAMLSQWLWILLYYADPVDGNHGVNAVPVGVNHVVLFWASRSESRSERYASRCESCWTLLRQWLWITVCYGEPVVVNHCELCWASGCETLWAMLRQLLWITVCYAEPVVVNHCELCWSSGCETLWVILSEWLWIILCYAEPGGWESWCAMLRQWLCSIVWYWAGYVGIMMCYVDPVGLNYGVLCWDGYVGIMVCFA